MKAHWHKVTFECACGLPGTILEVCINISGDIAITGLCVTCGKEFTIGDNVTLLIAKSAISDYLRCKQEKPEDFLLQDFQPTGKPS
jgi:hypothetical protein